MTTPQSPEDYWEQNRLIGHYLPLRPGVDAYVSLPRNLTAAEGARLARMVDALAFPDAPPPSKRRYPAGGDS